MEDDAVLNSTGGSEDEDGETGRRTRWFLEIDCVEGKRQGESTNDFREVGGARWWCCLLKLEDEIENVFAQGQIRISFWKLSCLWDRQVEVSNRYQSCKCGAQRGLGWRDKCRHPQHEVVFKTVSAHPESLDKEGGPGFGWEGRHQQMKWKQSIQRRKTGSKRRQKLS